MSPCFFFIPLHCVKGGTGEAGGVVSFTGEGVDAKRTG